MTALVRCLSFLLAVTVCVAAIAATPGVTSAASRSCGSDAVANTQSVLCSPPSGPCTAADVFVKANIEIPVGSCELDLGARSLRIERTLQLTGLGSLFVKNAASITIAPTGKLKARGDYLRPSNQIDAGGEIYLESVGGITHAGVIDVSGELGGVVALVAGGDVMLESGSTISARGASSIVENGGRIGDGGAVEMYATGGSIVVRGDIAVPGAARGMGGVVYAEATGDVTIEHAIDASGGAYDGGDIEFIAGRDLTVRGTLAAESRVGGGFGGQIFLLGGSGDAGGGVVVDGAILQMNGSSAEGLGGQGGFLEVGAHGPIRVQGAGAAVRANAGGQFDGLGGDISFDARNRPGQRDGDVTIEVPLLAQGGSDGSGGSVQIGADDDVVVRAPVTAFGKRRGGSMLVVAGGDASLTDLVDVSGKAATAIPGGMYARAGGMRVGVLSIAADVRTYGGPNRRGSGSVDLASCALRIAPGVRIDGSSGSEGGLLGGSVIRLASRQPMLLGAGSRYLGRPGGRVETIHPPGQDPVIGAGVVFDPLRVDTVIADDGVYPACPATP